MFRSDFGRFMVGSKTASGAAFAALVPPYRGPGDSPLVYGLDAGNRPNWYNSAYTTLTQLIYTAGATAHDVVVMRPFNWAKISTAVAANSSTIVLADNPGTYSANYKYSTPSGVVVSNTADNGIAANDYVAYQLKDGTWVLDTVSSVSSLTLTMTTATPNVTGGGIAAGQILFFFGVAANVDPATGLAHLALKSTASTRVDLLGNGLAGVSNLHRGDPMILYSANATNDGTLMSASGYYSN